MAADNGRLGAAQWLATPLGQHLLAREQAYFDAVVADLFGYNAFQLGMPEVDLLQASRIPTRCHVAAAGPADLRADFRELPIASSSADLVLLPHVLEFSDNPHRILREVARVLVPEGHVLVSCFNPWSLWGLARMFRRGRGYPWEGRFINLPRVKDWLALLDMDITGGQMACYVPPCTTRNWLERVAFMEAAGDRWWPIMGGVYFLQAVKRVHGMRIITPTWSERLAPAQALAPSPKKVRQPEDAIAARVRVTEDT